MPRVDVTFSGSSRGALAAARQTSTGIESVRRSASKANRELGVTDKSLNATARSARASGMGFRSLARMVTVASATFLGGAGIISLLKQSKDAASNLQEQTSKAGVVFGQASRAMVSWSRTTAQSLGIASDQALEFSGVFGNMLVPMGFARESAAQMSKRLVELAADMASFNNASPEETLEALRSGLSGETEPLRRFGVFLNEARIKQEALSSGLIRGKQELTAAGKAQAIYQIILKDTTDAQGDYQRTIDSAANSERRRNALWRESQITLGKALLPTYTRVTNAVANWLGKTENQEKIQKAANRAVEVATAAGKAFIGVARPMAQFAQRVANAVGGWENAFKIALGGWVFVKLLQLRRSFLLLAGAQGIGAATAAIGGPGKRGGLYTALLLLTRNPWVLTIIVTTVGLTKLAKALGAQVGSPLVSGDTALREKVEKQSGGKLTIEDGKVVRRGSMPPAGEALVRSAIEGGGGGVVGRPGQGTHSRSERGYIWQDDDAWDIEVQPHTVIVAVDDGTISRLRYGGDSGRFSGWGFTLTGRYGTYFYKHLIDIFTTNDARVKRGQPLGRGSTTGHLHFAKKGGGTAPSPAQMPKGTVPEFSTSSPTAKRGSGASSAPLYPGQGGMETRLADARLTPKLSDDLQVLLAMRGAITKARKGAKGERRRELSEALKEITDEIADVRKQIADRVAAEREKARAAAKHVGLVSAVMEEVFGVRETRERGGELRSRLARMTDEALKAMLDTMRQKIAEARRSLSLGRDMLSVLSELPGDVKVELADKWGRVVEITVSQLIPRVQAALARLQAAMHSGNKRAITVAIAEVNKYPDLVRTAVSRAADAARDQAERMIQGLRDAVDRGKDRVRSAIDRMMDLAFRAFDKQTDRMIREARVTVSVLGRTFDFYEGALTPTEMLLRRRQERRDAELYSRDLAEANRRIADAERELQKAREEGDPEAILAAERSLAEARQQLVDLQFDWETAHLERIAEKEREIAEKALEEERRRIAEEREMRRQALAEQLNDIVEAAMAGEITWEEALAQMNAALLAAGLGPEAVAEILGVAGAVAMKSAVDDLTAAIWDLIAALQELAQAEAEADFSIPGPGNRGGGGGGGILEPMQSGGRFPYSQPRAMLLHPGELVLNDIMQSRISKALTGRGMSGRAASDLVLDVAYGRSGILGPTGPSKIRPSRTLLESEANSQGAAIIYNSVTYSPAYNPKGYFLGTEREALDRLARDVDPALRRIIGFKNAWL